MNEEGVKHSSYDAEYFSKQRLDKKYKGNLPPKFLSESMT